MKCSELMKKEVECCDESTPISDVAERMRTKNIGFVPICNGNGEVVRTITDRDIVVRTVAQQRDPKTTYSKDVMSKDIVACRAEDDVDVAARLMSQHQKSRMLVLDDRGKPEGVISLSDLAKSQSDNASGTLKSVAQREAHA